jgi:NADH-quinone oxidoreductase subunit A
MNFLVFVGLTLVVGASILGLSALLGPKRPKDEKLDAYECGAPILDSARERFAIHFYLVAIMFMLFDIESVFLIPWAVLYKSLGTTGLIEMGIFVGILGFGLVYIIRRGVLKAD